MAHRSADLERRTDPLLRGLGNVQERPRHVNRFLSPHWPPSRVRGDRRLGDGSLRRRYISVLTVKAHGPVARKARNLLEDE
jgi:hypothetical protein